MSMNTYELMKRIAKNTALLVFLLCVSWSYGQNAPQKEAKLKAEAEKPPMVYQFEPNLSEAEAERRAEILQIRMLIDSLEISENKRRKLIRDLYKTNGTKKVSKYVLAETKFEEEE